MHWWIEQKNVEILIDHKKYVCAKITTVEHDVYFDIDGNLIPEEVYHTSYTFDVPINVTTHGECRDVIVKELSNLKPIQCYVSDDNKTIVAYNPIVVTEKPILKQPEPKKLIFRKIIDKITNH